MTHALTLQGTNYSTELEIYAVSCMFLQIFFWFLTYPSNLSTLSQDGWQVSE